MKTSVRYASTKNIIATIFRAQLFNNVWLLDFMLPGKKMRDFTSLFSPYDFEKK